MNQARSFIFPAKIETGASGHQVLFDFYTYASQHRNVQITLDWATLEFLEANLSALLLAMTWRLRKQHNLSFFLDPGCLRGTMGVFRRNGLAHYIYPPIVKPDGDERESVIPIKAFEINNVDGFVGFVERDFLRHRGMEAVAYEDKQKLQDSLLEVFSNVELHARTTNPVLVCGQFFPKQKELKFTLVDLGCGFLANVQAFTANDAQPIVKAVDAIGWAVRGNSTKKEAAGGTGLFRILNYCRKNNGGLHIVSDGCYWAFDHGHIENTSLKGHFPGATIHLIFRFN